MMAGNRVDMEEVKRPGWFSWVSIALGHFNIEMLGRKREIKQ